MTCVYCCVPYKSALGRVRFVKVAVCFFLVSIKVHHNFWTTPLLGDLGFIQDAANLTNSRKKTILVVIDLFSRYCQIRLQGSNTASETLSSFDSMLPHFTSRDPFSKNPTHFLCDRGMSTDVLVLKCFFKHTRNKSRKGTTMRLADDWLTGEGGAGRGSD